MACLSEIYFQSVVLDWDYKGQAGEHSRNPWIQTLVNTFSKDAAYKKCQVLVAAGCIFSEFGTRRRRSFHTQDLVLGAIVEASHDCPGEGLFSGTSNASTLSLFTSQFTIYSRYT
jgi:nicotinate phosphoribosyltransferase